MTDWIKDSVNQALADLWAGIHAKFISLVTLSFLDPFYHWFVYGGLIALGLFAIAWFFGGLFPWLRAVCGSAILAIAAALYIYRRGENDARAFDKPKQHKRK